MKKFFKFFIVFIVIAKISYVFPLTESLFSPDDRPKKRLIDLILTARQKIYAAVYMFTDKEIAQALITAKQKGVDVKMVVDTTSTNTPYAQVFALFKNKIPVFVFDTKQHNSDNVRARSFAPLMHNKFAVVDGLIWTGSFNWTVSANNRNQENVIITDDKNTHQKYEQQFAKLIQRCRSLDQPEGQRRRSPRTQSPLSKFNKWIRGWLTLKN